MKSILIDTGPLIALFDGSDNFHTKIVDYLARSRDQLVTSWQVITETCHMLSFSVNAQTDFLRWCMRGGVRIENIASEELWRIIELTEKYSSAPMDLADASLILISERLNLREILTIDSDYYIYRTMKKEMLTDLLRE